MLELLSVNNVDSGALVAYLDEALRYLSRSGGMAVASIRVKPRLDGDVEISWTVDLEIPRHQGNTALGCIGPGGIKVNPLELNAKQLTLEDLS